MAFEIRRLHTKLDIYALKFFTRQECVCSVRIVRDMLQTALAVCLKIAKYWPAINRGKIWEGFCVWCCRLAAYLGILSPVTEDSCIVSMSDTEPKRVRLPCHQSRIPTEVRQHKLVPSLSLKLRTSHKVWHTVFKGRYSPLANWCDGFLVVKFAFGGVSQPAS